jgi:hydrogenase expression/formation protein HypC
MCLAVPGRLLDISETDACFRAGRVDFGGIIKEVSLACVPEARVHDYVLVHAGVALTVLDAHEADAIFTTLRQLAAVPLPGDDPRAPP